MALFPNLHNFRQSTHYHGYQAIFYEDYHSSLLLEFPADDEANPVVLSLLKYKNSIYS